MEALVHIMEDVKLPIDVVLYPQLVVIVHMNTIYHASAAPNYRRTGHHPVIELTEVEEVRPRWLIRPRNGILVRHGDAVAECNLSHGYA